MTIPTLDDFIVKLVNNDGPIKSVDLAVQIVTHQEGITGDDITEAVNRLIEDGKIVEVEYALPSMPYRAKSMLFPGNTEISIHGGAQ